MTRLAWATFADTAQPMGLQTYESAVTEALLAQDAPGWTFERRTISSARAGGAADVRLPMRLLTRSPSPVASAMGRWAYRGCDVVHRFDLRLPPAPTAEVVTVHDLPPLRFRDEGSLPAWSGSTLRRARVVITPSAFAAAEVSTLLGIDSTVVIPNGVSRLVPDSPGLGEVERRSLALDRPRYVLHAGGATERKNLTSLARAWSLLASRVPDCELALAGPQDARRDAAFAGVPQVRLLGYCDRAQVGRLMASAACVVVPSVYEGFGLPALEAMAVGTPVVAADRGALPEVCGDAAVLCDPSPEGLVEALEQVLGDRSLQDALAAAGRARARHFTWERSAALHLETYDRFLA